MQHFTNEAVHERSEVRYVSTFCYFAHEIRSLWNMNLIWEMIKKNIYFIFLLCCKENIFK